MPYFRCERCSLRLYSAASKAHCPECSTPLGRAEQLLVATPLAQPRGHRHSTALAESFSPDARSSR